MNRALIDKARHLLQAEQGTIVKDPGGRLNIALCYPNTYGVGMSSLGFQGIYGYLNGFSDVVCERFFYPADDDVAEYEKSRTEPFSLESGRPLSAFDVIAFSVSFENDYPHVLRMLKMGHIPLRSSDRGTRYPLVIMGGACAFFNPEPLAEFMDVVFIGEAEDMLREFLNACRQTGDRSALLERCAALDGLYVPCFYDVFYDAVGRISERSTLKGAPATVVKQTASDINRTCISTTVMTPHAEFSDMYLIEAMRGCPWNCRFCVAGHIYRPVRKKELGVLMEEIQTARCKTRKIGLIGPSLTDYPFAEEVLKMEGVDFSITSLRASSRSGRLVKLLEGHRSISIAPEAGTQRLRDVISKRITEEDILETSRMILESGVETLRLYFMIGLPTETEEDVHGIISLVRMIRSNTRRGFIRMSVSTFVPKPFTPFQWHPMEQLRTVKAKLAAIKKGLAREKGIRVLHDVPKHAHLQGLFAMGDRRVGRVIELLAEKDVDVVKEGCPGVDIPSFIFRQKERSEVLPWDFIDAGVSKEHLWQEYRKAVNG